MFLYRVEYGIFLTDFAVLFLIVRLVKKYLTKRRIIEKKKKGRNCLIYFSTSPSATLEMTG